MQRATRFCFWKKCKATGGRKGEAKPYTLKINGEEKTVKPVNSEVVNGFYSPLEKTINETLFKISSKVDRIE